MKIQLTYCLFVICCVLFSNLTLAQHKFELDGELSTAASYVETADYNLRSDFRYLPQLNYKYSFNNKQFVDFAASPHIRANLAYSLADSAAASWNISPYRLWARYGGQQFELRLGLQKINFGSANALRPLQWFDEIDPRDPLKFTTGVYGLLYRYYFLNNANLWAWALYGNDGKRGFEMVNNNNKFPELGGRLQMPVPKGEIAFTYHNRIANYAAELNNKDFEIIPEHRAGFDAKFDLLLGLWTELAIIHKTKDIGLLTNQIHLSLGADYTFPLGNGLTVSVEHLSLFFDNSKWNQGVNSHLISTAITYPISLFDNLSFYTYHAYNTSYVSLFLNYGHNFKNISAYAMLFYNSKTEINGISNGLLTATSGPGLRIMLVYNH